MPAKLQSQIKPVKQPPALLTVFPAVPLFSLQTHIYIFFAINFSPQVIADKKQISKSRPCCIQYHIIYVKAPNLCNKLDDLYRNTKPKSCQYDQPSASHFVQNNRQYKSKWKKTNYISKRFVTTAISPSCFLYTQKRLISTNGIRLYLYCLSSIAALPYSSEKNRK